jgi:hypothetical protein
LGWKQQTLAEAPTNTMGRQPASVVFSTKEGQGGSQTSTQNLDFQEDDQTAEDKGDFESSVPTLDTGYEKSSVEKEVTSNEWAYREE